MSELSRVQGKELTAYDLARARRHMDCVDVLQQHAAYSAVDCRSNKVRLESQQVVQRAHDAAAREAQYWITDELELQQRAADIVATTVNNATASLQNYDHQVDDQPPSKVPLFSTLSFSTGPGTGL